MKRIGLPWILVLVGAFGAYGVALGGAFVYDDHHSVAENTALWSLANVPAFFTDVTLFSSLDNRMYRPVLLTTFAVDHAIAGGAVWMFKLTNVLLHAAAALLLAGLGRRLGLGRWAAAAAGLLFAVHPLVSETVNMISARSEGLLLVALLAGLHAHLYAQARGRGWPWVVALCGVIACGAKETGVVLPALVVALELVHWRQSGALRPRAVVVRLLPVVAVAVGYLLIRRALFGAATLPRVVVVGGADPLTGAGRDLLTQLCTMASALPGYLAQLVWPNALTLDPAVEFVRGPASATVLFGVVLIGGLTAWGLARPARRPVLFAATALAWLTSLPWIVVPLNVPLSEHRMYGLVAGAALAAGAALPRRADRGWLRAVAVAIPASFALGFGAVAFERSAAYRDECELWRRALVLAPESYRAHYSLGALAMRAGALEPALRHMRAAVARYPDYVSARRSIAELNLQLGERGDPVVALAHARWLVERGANNPFFRLLLSRALAAAARRTGDPAGYDQAVAAALSVHEFEAPKGLVYRTAAHARRLQGRPDLAVELLDESVSLGLDHWTVLLDRADAHRAAGQPAAAAADVRRAAQQAPFEPAVLAALQGLAAAPRD